MRTIEDHPVRFGELAGPLLHGSTFFDWQLVSTQEIAAAIDYPFQEIVASGGIPYAPVVVNASVRRYPTFEDVITVETYPRSVGDSSVELVYEVLDAEGDPLATARIVHVTIASDGDALPLPDRARSNLAEMIVSRDPQVGPTDDFGTNPLSTFESSFPIRSPHVEGSELAYFEEYPGFADVALEEYLREQGTSKASVSGEKQPFRVRNWRWEFKSPVRLETTLRVECEVVTADADTFRVLHTFSSDSRTHIEGTTEYGCFDRSGDSVAFEPEMVAPFAGT